jgi:hypothetical protein
MSLTLPDRPAQHFIDEVLIPSWDPADAAGYDPSASPGDEAFIPVATSLDNVGAKYPSLVIQYSSETSGGESTYDYMTPSGPGQNREGTLLAIARAEDGGAEYGDPTPKSGNDNQYSTSYSFSYGSDTYTKVDAEAIVVKLIEAVENVCQNNAAGGTSGFKSIGSQRGPEAPDDDEVTPPVRIANTQVDYSWLRRP